MLSFDGQESDASKTLGEIEKRNYTIRAGVVKQALSTQQRLQQLQVQLLRAIIQ